MNKIVARGLFLFLILNNIQLLFAENEPNVEIRAALFIPTSERFREIYENLGTTYQIEASTPWDESMNLSMWGNIDWFTKHGRSEGNSDPTRVNILNLSLGIKYLYPLSEQFTPYIGIGPNLCTIWLRNKSPCHHDRVSKVAIGGVLKTGIYYFFNESLFVDLFIDYLYQPVHFKIHVDVGGVKTGIGLGMSF